MLGRMPARSHPRLSKNHQLVYEIVSGAGHGVHLTTGEVFTRAKAIRPTIGFSTVYRGVQRLRDLRLIDEIAVPGAESAVYEPASDPHAHFRCDRCGAVEDVAFNLPARAIAGMAAATGARIEEAKLTLHGVCKACHGVEI